VTNAKRTVTIGLTGPIGAGQSTVSSMLRDLGACVVDSDALVRELLEPHTPSWDRIVAEFGPQCLRPNGEIDRGALASIVFRDPEKLRTLEGILHPAVAALRDQRLQAATEPVRVVEAIKLIEVGYHRECDELWVVTAPLPVRLQRLIQSRNITHEEALRRAHAQMPADEMERLADVVIQNHGSVDDLRARVAREWHRLHRVYFASGPERS